MNNKKENDVPSFSSIEACNERLEKLPKDIKENLEKNDFNTLFTLLIFVCKNRYYEKKKSLDPTDQLFNLKEYELMWLGCAKNFLISFRNSHDLPIINIDYNCLPKILVDYFNNPSNTIKQLMQDLIDILHLKKDKDKNNEKISDFYYEFINLYKTITGEWKKQDKGKDYKINNQNKIQYQHNNYQNGRGYHNMPQNGILGPGPVQKHYGGNSTFDPQNGILGPVPVQKHYGSTFDPQRRTKPYYKN